MNGAVDSRSKAACRLEQRCAPSGAVLEVERKKIVFIDTQVNMH